MIQVLRIPVVLPGMNELLSKACASRFAYAKIKKAHQETIGLFIRQQDIRPIDGPSVFEFDCFEMGKAGRTRDPDNVGAGARKLLLDSLQAAKVIPNDDYHYVRRIIETVHYNQSASSVVLKISTFKEN